LLGTSNSAYPRKKIPAPSPYIAALNPRSRFICSAAKLTFVRSMMLTTYMRNRSGMSRPATRRSVAPSKVRLSTLEPPTTVDRHLSN